MPQNGVNCDGRRRVRHLHSCKASGRAPDTGLVNGAIVHNGYPAAASSTSENTPAGTQNVTKPQHMVNGYINHVYKGLSRKALPSRTLAKRGGTIPAVTDSPAADRVSNTVVPCGISVNGAASLDTVSLPRYFDPVAPESSASVAKQRRRKKRPPKMPPQEKEDWENEIQEVTLIDMEKMHIWITPYAPEDMLHLAMQDLTVKQRDTVELSLTVNYSPAAHHPRPVPVLRHHFHFRIPPEPDQFADADE